jgi:hypothetical protein
MRMGGDGPRPLSLSIPDEKFKTEPRRHTFHPLARLVFATAPVVLVVAVAVVANDVEETDCEGVGVDVVVGARQHLPYA